MQWLRIESHSVFEYFERRDGMERGFATSGQGADGYVEDRRHALGEEGVRERGV